MMTDKDKITVKYHKHLEGDEPEAMVYFTREDVHKCMDEWATFLIIQAWKKHKEK